MTLFVSLIAVTPQPARATTLAEQPGNTTITYWSSSPTRTVRPGGTVSMTAMVATAGCGTVSLSSPVPAVGRRVIDLWRRVPGGTWTRIASSAYYDRGLQGAWFTTRPTRPVTYYQARYRGVSGREYPSASVILTVKVVPVVHGWGGLLGGNLRIGSTYPMRVSVSPAPSSILLQSHTAKGWLTVARLRRTTVPFIVRLPVRPGIHDWRLWLPATRSTVAAPSRTLTTVFGGSARVATASSGVNVPGATHATSVVVASSAEPLALPTSATWLGTVAEHADQSEICSGRAVRGQWVVRTRWLIHGGIYRDVVAGVDVRGGDHEYTDNDYRSMRFDPHLYGCMPTLWMRIAPIGDDGSAPASFYTDMGTAASLYWPSCPTA